MGLASLIKVAQGMSAESVSFEDEFLKQYEAAVKRQEERERQPVPTDYFRPSSMYGCERMLFFMRVHGGAGKEDVEDFSMKRERSTKRRKQNAVIMVFMPVSILWMCLAIIIRLRVCFMR